MNNKMVEAEARKIVNEMKRTCDGTFYEMMFESTQEDLDTLLHGCIIASLGFKKFQILVDALADKHNDLLV